MPGVGEAATGDIDHRVVIPLQQVLGRQLTRREVVRKHGRQFQALDRCGGHVDGPEPTGKKHSGGVCGEQTDVAGQVRIKTFQEGSGGYRNGPVARFPRAMRRTNCDQTAVGGAPGAEDPDFLIFPSWCHDAERLVPRLRKRKYDMTKTTKIYVVTLIDAPRGGMYSMLHGWNGADKGDKTSEKAVRELP